MRAPLFLAFLVVAGVALAGASSVGAGDSSRRASLPVLEVDSSGVAGCPYLQGQRAHGMRLPPGHPPVGADALDDEADALPPGHPPVDGRGGASRLPPGHPPVDHAMPTPRFDEPRLIEL